MNQFFLFCVLLFHTLSFSLNAFDDEHIKLNTPLFDVETLPYLRTKQYPLHGFSKAVVFSATRTGSSLAYNVMRFLFEDSDKLSRSHTNFSHNRLVRKTHKYADIEALNDKKIFYLFTIRNPIDACASAHRVENKKVQNFENYAKELVEKQHHHLTFTFELENRGCAVERLQYEKFAHDIEHLFDFIEKYFSIEIDPIDKELMRVGYSKRNVAACLTHLSSFKEFLPISGFHGMHLSPQDYLPPEELIKWVSFHLEGVKGDFQKAGYFLN